MPQPPGTGTTHHCPGAKLGNYLKLGACKVRNGCCRTHQKQCRQPLCKGWIHLNMEPCPKCVHRVEVSFDGSGPKFIRMCTDGRIVGRLEEGQCSRRRGKGKARKGIAKQSCRSLADQREESPQKEMKYLDSFTITCVLAVHCRSPIGASDFLYNIFILNSKKESQLSLWSRRCPSPSPIYTLFCFNVEE